MDSRFHSGVETLALIAGRLSHVLRTPLGTASAVIEDVRKGISLEPRDLDDASRALAKICEILDTVKACVVDSSTKASVDLDNVLAETVERCRSAGMRVDREKRTAPAILEEGSPALLGQAVFLLATFMSRGLTEAGAQSRQVSTMMPLSASVRDETGFFSFILHGPASNLTQLSAEPKSCRALAEVEHSIQALPLLFIEQAASYHGGSSSIWQNKSGLWSRFRIAKKG